MSVIYKYPIRIIDKQTIDMPFGANIISLQMQNGTAVMWLDGGNFVILPRGSIEKLIGRALKWSDEPVELT